MLLPWIFTGGLIQQLARVSTTKWNESFWRFGVIPNGIGSLSRPRVVTSVRSFPYAFIYLDQPDRVWIVATMHMKREPGYWRQRMEERL
jgi:hypothetical protein